MDKQAAEIKRQNAIEKRKRLKEKALKRFEKRKKKAKRQIEEPVKVSNVISMSGAICAYIIAMGFVAGRDVLQYFAAYGGEGIVGAMIFSLCLGMLGYQIMSSGFMVKTGIRLHIYKQYLGNVIGVIVATFATVFFLTSIYVTVDRTGVFMTNYFHMSPIVGKVAIIVLLVVTALETFDSVVDIMGTIGFFITLFFLVMGIMTIVNADNAVFTLSSGEEAALRNLRIFKGTNLVGKSFDAAWFSGIFFLAGSLLGAMPLMSGIGASANSVREIKWTAIISAVFMFSVITVIVCDIFLYPGQTIKRKLPIMFFVRKAFDGAQWVYVAVPTVIILSIYTTVLPLFKTVVEVGAKVLEEKNKPYKVSIALGIALFFGDVFRFDRIQQFLNPFAIRLGLLFVILVPLVSFFVRVREEE